jgi:hypothetical protein
VLLQLLDAFCRIDGLGPLGERVSAMEVHMLPGCQGDLLECGRPRRIAHGLFVRQKLGEQGGVVVDAAVCEEAAALAPDLLFLFALEAELAEVGIGDRST